MSSALGFTYSYSGADCKTFAFFPGIEFLAKKVQDKKLSEKLKKVIPLDSLATVSISVHEAKSPVRRLGERGVAGYSRGIRTIAGTMVFVVIEDHPLRRLAMYDPANVYDELIGWSRDLKTKGTGSLDNKMNINYFNKVATLISPVNVVMHYQTEVGFEKKDKEGKKATYAPPGASMMLEGVEFINEGIVTSVNDMVTEVVVQFVAQDFTEFTYSGGSSNEKELTELYKQLNDKSDLYKTYYEDLIESKREGITNNENFGSVNIKVDGYN